MASNPIYINEDDIYLTPQNKVDEILRKRKNESSHVDQDCERGYKGYSLTDSTNSNVSSVSEMDEVHVLEDRKTIQPQPESFSKPRKKTEGEGIYDEDLYSIANPKNCVTERAGVLAGMSKNEIRQTVKKRKRCCSTKNRLKVVGLIIGLICLGGISGLLFTIFSGNISMN